MSARKMTCILLMRMLSAASYGICRSLVSWWAVGFGLNGDYKRLGDSYNPSTAHLQVYHPWTNSHVLLRPASRRGSMGIGNEEWKGGGRKRTKKRLVAAGSGNDCGLQVFSSFLLHFLLFY